MLDLKNKKVLVMGLGSLGGGIATTKWLVKHGARVTVTDLKTKKELSSSIKALGKIAKKVKFVLGKHRLADFEKNEIIVVNPAVPRESFYLKFAQKKGVSLENEASLFFRYCRNPIIAVTGTRGKTTTVNWLYYLLKQKYKKTVLTGNSSKNPMLKTLDLLDKKSPVVVELSSWHCELLPKAKLGPQVAVITNLYPDHLNRYKGMKDYFLAKANIFINQTEKDFLFLNKNNFWTKKFLALKPKSKVIFFPKAVGFSLRDFKKKYGEHNFYNLNVAILIAKNFGVSISKIKKAIKNLPTVLYRQELVLERRNFKVINDSAATSPDATVAALKRFSKEGELILIAGGTDKKLYFNQWAKAVKNYVKPENLFLINSSATKKMIKELKKIGFFKENKPLIFEDLYSLLKEIRKNKLETKKGKYFDPQLKFIILFSPGAASFEKFKNEFDRGEKFNKGVKSLFC